MNSNELHPKNIILKRLPFVETLVNAAETVTDRERDAPGLQAERLTIMIDYF